MSDLGISLLALARNTLAAHFGLHADEMAADVPELRRPGATFVTLTQHGKLRGCIGTLQAWRPLGLDVQENALAAAFRDPRFKALRADEFPYTRIEVSRLMPAEPLSFTDEADALAQLQPGLDGVILVAGPHHATFLPQVWEQLPEPSEFIAHLKRKAGLAEDYWGDDVRLERYRVEKWKETPC